MSGGVDSTVAAYLLKKEGYDVIGVTLELWQTAGSKASVEDARRVCEKLEIPFFVFDFKEGFRKHVVDHFIDAYLHGLTPNPCIMCNRYVKGEALLNEAHELGAKYIATGHYARIEKHPKTDRLAIKNSATAEKDQTYALYRMTQEQLEGFLLPIGDYTKDEIRKIAEEIDGFVAKKGDSQDICFIPDGDYAAFIKNTVGTEGQAGNFVNRKGEILGKHKGLIHYTVGQRKGLGIAFGKPMYVFSIDPEQNEVILCDNEELFQKKLYANQLAQMGMDTFADGGRYMAKIRYSHKPAWCSVKLLDKDVLECTFDEPQRAITPGQSLVLYDNDLVAGGGIVMPFFGEA